MPQALSNSPPSLTFSGNASVQKRNVSPDSRGVAPSNSEGTTYPAGYSLSLNQQIFRGFRTHNATSAAEASVRAGRQTLRLTEQTVLLEGVTAFMNVIRDTAIVKLREDNVRILSNDIKTTEDRLSFGDVTQTDLAQSYARRSQAALDLQRARMNLKASRANYELVIGHPPGLLREPKLPYRLLPKTLKETQHRAEHQNPKVLAALYREQEAHFQVKEIAGELLPMLQIDTTYSNQYSGGGDWQTEKNETGTFTGRLSVPLYQRGLVSSRVRQAKH